MSPLVPFLLFMQVVFSALAAIKGVLPGCGACGVVRPHDFALGILGALFYLVMWLTSTQGWSRRIVVGAGAASGVHAALAARMAAEETFCLWCSLAAAGSFAVALLLAAHPRTPKALMACCAAAAAAVCTIPRIVQPPPAPRDELRITAYTSPDCAYCRELETSVMPEIQREYGDRLVVEYRPADGTDWVRRTPTIVIEDPEYPQVIEGLPSQRHLRRLIGPRLSGREAAP